MIDWTQMRTPATLAAEALAARQNAARTECRQRILAVVPETTQANLTAAAAADLLPPADRTTFAAGLGWIAAMRATWPALAEAGTDPAADASWPPLPPGVAELAARY